jgi:serine/threonine protein kinase
MQPLALSLARHKDWTEIAFVGGGAFKETYRVIMNNGTAAALKIVNPEKSSPARSQREITAMIRCSSPRIAALFGYDIGLDDEGNRFLYMLEEFLDGGTLTDRLQNGCLEPEGVRALGLGLAEALTHLYSLRLVHRDIKPDNIMFRAGDPQPVLVDFGLVRDLSESSLTRSWVLRGPGTPLFSAPEQLNNDKQLIDWRTDQFALGLVLGVALTGQHPFWSKSAKDDDIVERMAQRNSCGVWFAKRAAQAGLSCLPRMLEPWPVRRYAMPVKLILALAGE